MNTCATHCNLRPATRQPRRLGDAVRQLQRGCVAICRQIARPGCRGRGRCGAGIIPGSSRFGAKVRSHPRVDLELAHRNCASPRVGTLAAVVQMTRLRQVAASVWPDVQNSENNGQQCETAIRQHEVADSVRVVLSRLPAEYAALLTAKYLDDRSLLRNSPASGAVRSRRSNRNWLEQGENFAPRLKKD